MHPQDGPYGRRGRREEADEPDVASAPPPDLNGTDWEPTGGYRTRPPRHGTEGGRAARRQSREADQNADPQYRQTGQHGEYDREIDEVGTDTAARRHRSAPEPRTYDAGPYDGGYGAPVPAQFDDDNPDTASRRYPYPADGAGYPPVPEPRRYERSPQAGYGDGPPYGPDDEPPYTPGQPPYGQPRPDEHAPDQRRYRADPAATDPRGQARYREYDAPPPRQDQPAYELPPPYDEQPPTFAPPPPPTTYSAPPGNTYRAAPPDPPGYQAPPDPPGHQPVDGAQTQAIAGFTPKPARAPGALASKTVKLGDLLAIGGGGFVFLCSFLPFVGYSDERLVNQAEQAGRSSWWSALALQTFMAPITWFVVLAALGVTVFTVLRVLREKELELVSFNTRQLEFVLAVFVSVVLLGYAFSNKPIAYGLDLGGDQTVDTTLSLRFGGYLMLLFAGVTLAGAVLTLFDAGPTVLPRPPKAPKQVDLPGYGGTQAPYGMGEYGGGAPGSGGPVYGGGAPGYVEEPGYNAGPTGGGTVYGHPPTTYGQPGAGYPGRQ